MTEIKYVGEPAPEPTPEEKLEMHKEAARILIAALRKKINEIADLFSRDFLDFMQAELAETLEQHRRNAE